MLLVIKGVVVLGSRHGCGRPCGNVPTKIWVLFTGIRPSASKDDGTSCTVRRQEDALTGKYGET